MILSVCPNPSVDCTIELDTLKTGSLNSVENKVITYSGKALNVAAEVKGVDKKDVLTAAGEKIGRGMLSGIFGKFKFWGKK